MIITVMICQLKLKLKSKQNTVIRANITVNKTLTWAKSSVILCECVWRCSIGLIFVRFTNNELMNSLFTNRIQLNWILLFSNVFCQPFTRLLTRTHTHKDTLSLSFYVTLLLSLRYKHANNIHTRV